MSQNRTRISVEKRTFGVGHHLRPNFVQFYKCKNVFLEDITCDNADHAWYISGYESEPIQNISLRNISIIKVDNPVFQQHVVAFSMDNVNIVN